MVKLLALPILFEWVGKFNSEEPIKCSYLIQQMVKVYMFNDMTNNHISHRNALTYEK